VALRYVIKARARREIARLNDWWTENRLSAPDAVPLEVEHVLGILVHQPGLGQKVETGRPIQVRRYLMSKTQRWMYFRVKNDVLEVLCVWGTEREHGPRL
jgi:hypothetical protein